MKYDKIESDRLIYKNIEENDIIPLFNIQNDPVNFKYTIWTDDLQKYRNKILSHELTRKQFQVSPWVIINKNESKIIGWGGLLVDPFDPGWGYEVVYFFQKEYWNKGYASELVESSLSIGFDHLDLEKITAFAHPENAGSIKVLEKNNFVYQNFRDDLFRNIYKIDKGDWKSHGKKNLQLIK
jgi:RimJ/RimL family protein N-acetyltransferase